MNKQQKEYAKAKALLEVLEDEAKEKEIEFVKSLHIVNNDGTTPSYTWTIEDDTAANKAIDDFGGIMEKSGLSTKILAAKKALKEAEENLIKYALDLAPTHEKSILEKAAKADYKVREKIIDLAFKLDTKTVK